MNRLASAKEIIGGYALAGATLCLGMYLGLKIDSVVVGTAVVRVMFVLAALAIGKSTFAWGQHRGILVVRADGTISIENLLRNLVMSAIMFYAVVFTFGPLVMLVSFLAR